MHQQSLLLHDYEAEKIPVATQEGRLKADLNRSPCAVCGATTQFQPTKPSFSFTQPPHIPKCRLLVFLKISMSSPDLYSAILYLLCHPLPILCGCWSISDIQKVKIFLPADSVVKYLVIRIRGAVSWAAQHAPG